MNTTSAWPEPIRPQPVLIDADPAITVRPALDLDDDLAILFALGSPELEVRAITTTYGNAPGHRTVQDARRLLALAGREEIPLARGAGWRSRDLGIDTDASRRIEAEALRSEGELVVVTLGPLTNFARALRANPAIGEQIRGHLAMGGRSPGGLELNFSAHPEATRVVLEAPIPRVLIPMEACLTVAFTARELAAVREATRSVACRFAGRIEQFIRSSRLMMPILSPLLFRGHEGRARGGFHPWDVVAVAYLVRPDLFVSPERVGVEMKGRRAVCAPREGQGWANAAVAPKGVRAEPFLELMVERILRVEARGEGA